MIKKFFLFALALFTVTVTVNAEPTEVPLTVKTQPNDGGRPRSPIDIPVFYLDGHTLTASSYTVGSTVQLLDENDNVVYSTYIYIEGDILLPTSLSGTYTIEVTRGDQTFEGEIELE
jgi:hypothetical protein